MRVKSGMASIVALALGGCLGPEAAPGVTGSVRPALALDSPMTRPDRSERILADAVTACLDRGVPVKTPEFRHCVTGAQPAPRSEAIARSGPPAR